MMAARDGTPSDYSSAAHWLLTHTPVLVVPELSRRGVPRLVG